MIDPAKLRAARITLTGFGLVGLVTSICKTA